MLNVTKRTKNLLKGGAVVLLLGVGARIYAELYGPQKRPLSLQLTKDPTPFGTVVGGKSLSLPLQIVGRPKVSERPIEGPRCKWTLDAFEHRASPAESWRDYPSAGDGYSLLQSTGDHAALGFPGNSPGEWKARVHAEVEYWDDDTKDTWQGAVTREFEVAFSPTDLARIAAADKENTRRALIEAAQPPKGSVVLVKGKKYISKLQYSDDGEVHWQDVPLPGSPKYPLIADDHAVLVFRAVKVNPKEKWPDYPDMLPTWKQNNYKGDYFGDSVSFQFTLDQPSDALQTVTAHCGNQISTQVRVLPSGDGDMLIVSDKKDLAVEASGDFSQAQLTLRSDHTEARYKNARFRLFAHYADGKPADVINGPGTKDDLLPLDEHRFAYATLHAGRKVGKLSVSAMLVGPDGKNLSNTQEELEVEVHANWWAREQEALR